MHYVSAISTIKFCSEPLQTYFQTIVTCNANVSFQNVELLQRRTTNKKVMEILKDRLIIQINFESANKVGE